MARSCCVEIDLATALILFVGYTCYISYTSYHSRPSLVTGKQPSSQVCIQFDLASEGQDCSRLFSRDQGLLPEYRR